jgi:hypothetical protein
MAIDDLDPERLIGPLAKPGNVGLDPWFLPQSARFEALALAASLGGEKWIEDLGLNIRRSALPRIRDTERDKITCEAGVNVAGLKTHILRRHGDGAALAHGVARIHSEI